MNNTQFKSLINILFLLFLCWNRKITDIVNSTKSAGSQTIQWDADGYPSGIYFIKMQADDYTKTQKMMLLK